MALNALPATTKMAHFVSLGGFPVVAHVLAKVVAYVFVQVPAIVGS